MGEGNWWVFHRPVTRDRMFIAAVVVGGVFAVLAVVRADDPGVGMVVYLILTGLVSGWFAAGVVLGSVRNFRKGYRGDDHPG